MKKEALNENCGRVQGSGNVWSDDRTEIYVGSCMKITSKQFVSQRHPKPRGFEFEGNCCEYLYFICWSNDKGENGFLADIRGDRQVLTGINNDDWEVFAAGINKDVNSTVTVAEIDQQLKRACKIGWDKPFVGQKNDGSKKPFVRIGINPNARFIWHDSEKDNRPKYPAPPFVPFDGFNHDEFLIFRFPLKKLFMERCAKCECDSCDCCSDNCDGCNENAAIQDKALIQRAKKKYNTIPDRTGTGCNPYPFEGKECNKAFGNQRDISPCIYFHWGDSNRDSIENHDTEIVYVTVCNPFEDVEFKGFRITKINLITNPSQAHQARIIPDSFINYDCLSPCSCKTREFTLLTRDELNNYTGPKSIEIEYCWDELVVKKNNSYGVASFGIDIVKDEE